LEDARISAHIHSLLDEQKNLTIEMLGFFPASQEEFENGLKQVNPEWADVFQKLETGSGAVSLDFLLSTVFFQNKILPLFTKFLMEKTPELSTMTPAQVETRSAEFLLLAKPILKLSDTRFQYLVKKARNSSNPKLSQ